MIEVHPPEEKIHGIKDFLLHIFTVTVGLFIALLLESGVEKLHQHHLRDEADRNIRQEIRDNEHELQVTLDATVTEKQNLVEALKFLQAKSEGKPYDISKISLSYTSGGLKDASWHTASATGAVTFMDYDHVGNFAGAYTLQEAFTRLDAQTLEDYLQVQSYVAYGFDPNKVSPEDAKAATADVRKTLAHVIALADIGNQLKAVYEKVLLK